MKTEFINIVTNELTKHEQKLVYKASRSMYNKPFGRLEAHEMASVLCKVADYVNL